ncbi:hypothetical protein J7M07_08805 [bacterium]|nr:hypothetical protein [bacterium]
MPQKLPGAFLIKCTLAMIICTGMKKEIVPRRNPAIIIPKIYKDFFLGNCLSPNARKKAVIKAVAIKELNIRKRIVMRAVFGVLDRSKNPNEAEIAPSDRDERMNSSLEVLIFLYSRILIPGRRISPIARKDKTGGRYVILYSWFC